MVNLAHHHRRIYRPRFLWQYQFVHYEYQIFDQGESTMIIRSAIEIALREKIAQEIEAVAAKEIVSKSDEKYFLFGLSVAAGIARGLNK